jgi:hypothetical protein
MLHVACCGTLQRPIIPAPLGESQEQRMRRSIATLQPFRALAGARPAMPQVLTDRTKKGVDNPIEVAYNFAACTQAMPVPADGRFKCAQP